MASLALRSIYFTQFPCLKGRKTKLRSVYSEIKTGYEDFDSKVAITSSNKSLSLSILKIDRVRTQIIEILDLGFTSVSITKRGLEAYWYDFNSNPILTPILADRIVNALSQIQESTSDIFKHAKLQMQEKQNFNMPTKYLLLSIAIICISSAIFSIYRYEIISTSCLTFPLLYTGIPLFALHIIVILRSFSGSFINSTQVTHMFAWGAICACSLGIGVLLISNSVFDHTNPEVHLKKITEYRIETNAKTRPYHLVIEPWRKGLAAPDFSVSKSTFDEAKSKPWVRIVSKRGYWGFDWIVSKEFLIAKGPS